MNAYGAVRSRPRSSWWAVRRSPSGLRRDRITADVDAITPDAVVIEEARAIAQDRGLPQNWLNPDATMWMPPLPAGVLDPPDEAGLRVTYAEGGFLFATKLLAQRTKDAEDLVALANELGLATAAPQQLEAHIRTYYTDQAALEFIVTGQDVDREIELLARDASQMLSRAAASEPRDDSDDGVNSLRRP